MSSKPSPDGVLALRALARKYRTLQKELGTLADRIAADTKRHNVATEEYRQTIAAIREKLESMDCRADGNFGWENRIAWMLSEFEAQANPGGLVI